jgi:hypothetical protein
MVAAVGRGDIAHDVGDRADAVHVAARRLGRFRVALHQDADLALLAHRLLGGGDRARPAHRDRQHQPRKQHEAAHRNDDQGVVGQRRHGRRRRLGQSVRFVLFVSHGAPPPCPA